MPKPKTFPIQLESIPKPRYGGRDGDHSTDGHLPHNDSKGRPLFVTDATHARAVAIFDGVCPWSRRRRASGVLDMPAGGPGSRRGLIVRLRMRRGGASAS
jgi:hypothetical protein